VHKPPSVVNNPVSCTVDLTSIVRGSAHKGHIFESHYGIGEAEHAQSILEAPSPWQEGRSPSPCSDTLFFDRIIGSVTCVYDQPGGAVPASGMSSIMLMGDLFSGITRHR